MKKLTVKELIDILKTLPSDGIIYTNAGGDYGIKAADTAYELKEMASDGKPKVYIG